LRIARIFPTRTTMSPDDFDAYFDVPDLFVQKYDEIHISVAFTWDIEKANYLAKAWADYGIIKVGGVAIDGESTKPFISGMYLKSGITITTRGCPKNCKFCQVNKGNFIELDNFPIGNIVQDNNILASSNEHWNKVIAMLKNQKQICFKGGLDCDFLNDKHIEDMKSLKIKELWFACDDKTKIEKFKNAILRLQKAGFSRDKIFCYVLVGDDMVENENRLIQVYKAGAIPFAQLYKNKQNSILYSKEWRQFARKWSRPASIKSMMKKEK
jgi:hypothetical protein